MGLDKGSSQPLAKCSARIVDERWLIGNRLSVASSGYFRSYPGSSDCSKVDPDVLLVRIIGNLAIALRPCQPSLLEYPDAASDTIPSWIFFSSNGLWLFPRLDTSCHSNPNSAGDSTCLLTALAE
jgi:hypothetical protein